MTDSNRICPDCDQRLEAVTKNSLRDKKAEHFLVTYTGQCKQHGAFKWHESFERVRPK